MAKVILEFCPYEDQYELETAMNAGKFRSALAEIERELRNRVKYKENLSEELREAYQEIRSWVWDAVEGVEP